MLACGDQGNPQGDDSGKACGTGLRKEEPAGDRQGGEYRHVARWKTREVTPPLKPVEGGIRGASQPVTI